MRRARRVANDVSARIAQLRLLPALAVIDAVTVVLGDGYAAGSGWSGSSRCGPVTWRSWSMS